jgi:trigger factor
LAGQAKSYEDKKGKTVKAAEGDQLTIDFLGKLDGEPFDGGAAEDAQLVIGSNRFIPGFEEQLKGAKVGDETDHERDLPGRLPSRRILPARLVTFDVKVKAIKAEAPAVIDDEFAKRIGIESLDKLKDLLRTESEPAVCWRSAFQAEAFAARCARRRTSFDAAAEDGRGRVRRHLEARCEADKEAGRLTEEDAKKSDKKLKEEYHKIAERRVRLGLVLAEIGRAHNVQRLRSRAEQRDHAGSPQLSGPGASGAGLLPSEPQRCRPDARADL